MLSCLFLLNNFTFNSGYDFGYLLKLLTNEALPAEEADFFELLRMFFPKIYDVKYLMKSCKSLKGGLQEVSEILEVYVLTTFVNFFKSFRINIIYVKISIKKSK